VYQTVPRSISRAVLTINGQGGLSTAAKSTLDVKRKSSGDTTNADGFDPLGTSCSTSATGTNNPPQLLEAMSQDLGPNVSQGFTNNSPTARSMPPIPYVELVDQSANSPGNAPQALYVTTDSCLPVQPSTWTALNFYYRTEQINGTIISGGAVISGEVYDDVHDSGTLDRRRFPASWDGPSN